MPPIPAQRSPRDVDAAIAALAARQHGVVEHSQLIGGGVTRHEISRRVGAFMHRIHRGVYAVGHRKLTREGRWLAAVLAVGDDAVLSHESAAALLELRLGKERLIHVTAPTKRRDPSGVRVHRAAIEPTDIWTRQGIPVTSAARTIFDLAATLQPNAVEKLIREAEYAHLTSAAALTSRLSTSAPRRGSRTLAKALHLTGQTRGRARSPLEDDFLHFLRRHALPLPELNATLELNGNRIEVDCLWRRQRVIAELDGGDAHRTTHAFHADRARDLSLQAAGWRTVRVTSRALRDGTSLAIDLGALLARRNLLCITADPFTATPARPLDS